MKKAVKRFYKKNRTFINYGMVSFICTIILYITYFVVSWLTGGLYILANLIAYIVSFSLLFVWDQKLFKARPFRKKKRILQVVNFIGFRAIGFGFESILLIIFIEKLLITNMVAKLISMFITFMYNYVTNKLFVFKDKIE